MTAESFICIFLPSLEPIYISLSVKARVLPIVALSFRFLLFRVIYGFAKLKFFGKFWVHLDYIKWFLMGQPLPSPIAKYLFSLRPIFHSVLLFLMFLAEVVAPIPLFVFISYEITCLSFLSVFLLMLSISLCGCFGVFNLLTTIYCLVGFDPVSPWSSQLYSFENLIKPSSLILIIWILFGFLNFPHNSWRLTWCSSIFQKDSYYLRWPLRPLVALLRYFAPLRLSHPYGVFSIRSPDKFRPCIAFEVSIDEQKTWHMFSYRFFPHRPKQQLHFISPYQPRFDYVSVYAGKVQILIVIV